MIQFFIEEQLGFEDKNCIVARDIERSMRHGSILLWLKVLVT